MSAEEPPKGSSGEDPWAVQLDEDFIRGGRHEPPARTRESIARYGGERTSWRQGGPSEPGRRGESGLRTKRSHRGRWAGIAILALAVLGVAAYLGVLPGHRNSVGTIAATSAPVAPVGTIAATSGPATASPSPANTQALVHGVTPADPVGTCYSSPDPTSPKNIDVTKVSCTSAHSFELASHETAAGAINAYPSADYWDGPVAQTCLRDLVAYSGKDPSQFPAGLSNDQFIPTAQSWASGDRSVYCLAETVPAVTTTAKRH